MLEHHQKPPQLSFDETIQSLPISQELLPLFEQDKIFLERLASQLNQSPKRESTFNFAFAWFFGMKGVIALIFVSGIIFYLYLFVPTESHSFFGGLIPIFVPIPVFFACIHIYYRIRTLWMLKNGYFTLGLQIKSEGPIVYKDESGVTRLWNPSWSSDTNSRLTSDSTPQSTTNLKQGLSQPSSANNDNYLNLIAVDRRNPDNILIVYMADDYRETNTDISFSFPEWFGNSPLPVKYDLSSKTFSTTWNRIEQYITIIAGVIVVVIEIFFLLLIIIAIINGGW